MSVCKLSTPRRAGGASAPRGQNRVQRWPRALITGQPTIIADCRPSAGVPTPEFAPSIAVSDQGIAQGILERVKPRFEMFPLVKALAVDRLPHLLRARGSDASFGLVELDAARLELEAAEIENPPPVAFQVLDDVLW